MYNFFDYYTELPANVAMPNFGIAHICSIIFIAVLILVSLKLLRKLNNKKQQLIIKICAILVPILEISHNIWLYICADAKIEQLLSLHLCGLQMYFIPLAVFTKFVIFKDFTFATSILGGIFAIIFPSGITDTYPLWHFQTLQTFAYHALLIFVPLAMLITTDYRPTIKRFHKVLALFFIITLIAFIVDIFYNQNYLFLIIAPDFLHNMQLTLGTGPYLLFTFFVLLISSVLLHLPFDIKSNMENKESS